MAGRPIAAKNANIRIGAFVFYGAQWEVNPEADWPDTTNFEGGGFEQQVAAISKCTVNFSGFYDGDQNPYDNPPNLQPGQELSTVKLYVKTLAGPFWLFPLLDILGVPMTAEVKGVLHIRVSGKGNGAWTYPTGAAP